MWLKSVVPAVVTLAAVLPSLGAVAPPAPALAPAEGLFRAGRVAEARSLLRRVVASDPTAEAAAEAECRLGQSYEDAGDTAHAIAAYLTCRRLRGGDAADTARRRLESLVEARDGAAHEKSRPEEQAARAAAAALKALARPGLTAAARDVTERRLATLLVRACGGPAGSPEGDALLPPAIAAVRASDLNEILRYLRVMFPAALPHPPPLASRRPALLAFGQTAQSPALRAAALWEAALAGVKTDDPDRLFASLPAWVPPAAVAADPEVVFLTQNAGRYGLTGEMDPKVVVGQAVSTVYDWLVRPAFDAGRLEDMMRYDAGMPDSSHPGDRADEHIAMYRQYPDFDRAPLRLFARASAQREAAPADAVPLFLSVARQYPASALAVPSLLAAMTLLRQTHQYPQAGALRAEILRDHPDTPAGLLLRAEDAALRDDLDGAEALLLRADPPQPITASRRPLKMLACDATAASSPYMVAQDLHYGVSELREVIQWTRTVRAALRPVAAAAGRPALAEVPLRDVAPAVSDLLGPASSATALADPLADEMPSQAVAVYRALLSTNPFLSLSLSLHALARDPLGPQTAPVWDSLMADSALDAGVFPWTASADEIAVAAGLLERTAGTPRASQGLTLFERVISGVGGVPTGRWRPAFAAALALADAGRGTRAGVAARNVAARRLLENGRPEDAAALLRCDIGPALVADDPVRAEGALLGRRAVEEIAAKRGPEWAPRWVSQVGPAGEIVSASYPPQTPPGVTGGTLVVLWAGNAPLDDDGLGRAWGGVAGLDPATGRRKWATPTGSVYDVAGAAGRTFVVTQAGQLVALEAATGRVLYRQGFGADTNNPYPRPVTPQPGHLVATSQALVCVLDGFVFGLDPATGRTRWLQPWILSGLLPWSDKPAVIGRTLYCMTAEGHLRAVDPATGAVRWDRAMAADADSRRIGSGQPISAGLRSLLARRGENLQVLSTRTGLPLPAARAAPGRIWMDGLLADGRYVVKWDQNMAGDVSRLPDLTALGVSVAAKSVEDHALLQGGILYAAVCDAETNATVFQAVDVATGAVLGWWPLDRSIGSWVDADGKCVYLAGADGSVLSFPRLGAAPRTGLTTRSARRGRRRASSPHL